MSKVSRKRFDIVKQQRKKKMKKERETMRQMSIIRLTSMLVLRNNGWGATRIERFNEQFNEILVDVSHGLLSFEDILVTLEDEVGLDLSDIWVK